MAESLDSSHQAGKGWPPDLRCSTESTHLDLDAGTGGQVLRPCVAELLPEQETGCNCGEGHSCGEIIRFVHVTWACYPCDVGVSVT